ncbi:MAG: hypothetical protein WDM71_10415 [Ferruginibacter sp.]
MIVSVNVTALAVEEIGAFITKNKTVLDTIMKFAQARLSPPSFAQLAGEAAADLA